jgi:hypothetical protein
MLITLELQAQCSRFGRQRASRVFRGKFVDRLKRAFHNGQLVFPGSLQPLLKEKACQRRRESAPRRSVLRCTSRGVLAGGMRGAARPPGGLGERPQLARTR